MVHPCQPAHLLRTKGLRRRPASNFYISTQFLKSRSGGAGAPCKSSMDFCSAESRRKSDAKVSGSFWKEAGACKGRLVCQRGFFVN
jgi:hypothetical protein